MAEPLFEKIEAMNEDLRSLNDDKRLCECAEGCEHTDAGCEDEARAQVAKTRKCLVCKAPFLSAWAGERVCRRCKATSAWRGGALG